MLASSSSKTLAPFAIKENGASDAGDFSFPNSIPSAVHARTSAGLPSNIRAPRSEAMGELQDDNSSRFGISSSSSSYAYWLSTILSSKFSLASALSALGWTVRPAIDEIGSLFSRMQPA